MSIIGIGKVFSSAKPLSLGISASCMIFRPLITLSNKDLSPETKKYTASREFFTEFFGLINTYTLVSAIEKFTPKILAKKLFNVDLTKQLGETIKKAGWDQLPIAQQKIKAIMGLSSFIGVAASASVITPLLNNLVLGKFIDKIAGKGKTEDVKPQTTPNLFKSFGETGKI